MEGIPREEGREGASAGIFALEGRAFALVRQRIQNSLLQGEGPAEIEKKKLLEEYPGEAELLSILFSFPAFLEDNKRIKKTNESLASARGQAEVRTLKENIRREVLALTQYNFVVTHYLATAGADPRVAAGFWDLLGGIARAKGGIETFQAMRRGILSQVATKHIFDALGLPAHLSHPREDAFNAIDLWAEDGHALQVKSSSKETVQVIRTDQLSFPSVAYTQDGTTRSYDARGGSAGDHRDAELRKFCVGIDRYNERYNTKIEGYFVVIPYGGYDAVTGVPKEETVEAVGRAIGVPAPSKKNAPAARAEGA